MAASWGGWVDAVAELVDDHVVMPPAEGRQFVGVVSLALGVGDRVVRFEPVERVASVGGAGAVSGEDEAA